MSTIISKMTLRITTSNVLLTIFLLCFSISTVLAQAGNQEGNREQQQQGETKPTIYTGPDNMAGYIYHGCYNETTEVQGTSGGTRALYNGKNEVKHGEMTVQSCLAFCTSGDLKYKYAGLEYAKECWCAQQLASFSAKLDDKACNLPCDGDKSQICGGALKLTVYIAGAPSRMINGLSALWVLGLAGVVGLGLMI